MTDYYPAFPVKYLMTLTIGALLILSQGCTQKPVIEYGDIADRVWLRTSNDLKGINGFFTGKEGQLLQINALLNDGLYWELKENQLLLWFRAEGQSTPQSLEYHPLMFEGKLRLAEDLSDESSVYVARALQEPLRNVQYYPTYFRGTAAASPDREDQAAYLQLDTDDRSLRGFGGVNNFFGSYQRKDAVGFNVGPITSTMMAGPGMEYEATFMQCLDQSDAILAVDKRLFFYQASHLLCSFSAD
jgi:heat shock protein HslJ